MLTSSIFSDYLEVWLKHAIANGAFNDIVPIPRKQHRACERCSVYINNEAVNFEGRTVKQNKPVIIRKTREIDNIHVWVNLKP